ncbi:MAG: hypothetical protein JWM96_1095 [Alphaproteobacteria bacterium]|nr:hypothetical protein [Alphaproteobacteria bacterium]
MTTQIFTGFSYVWTDQEGVRTLGVSEDVEPDPDQSSTALQDGDVLELYIENEALAVGKNVLVKGVYKEPDPNNYNSFHVIDDEDGEPISFKFLNRFFRGHYPITVIRKTGPE